MFRNGLFVAALAGCVMACGVASAQSEAAPSKGYLMPSGSIRIVGAASMQGVIVALDNLFIKTHPGVRFHYEPANNNGAIDALIFDASAFAPLSAAYGGGIAYSDIVKAPPFSIRIAHASTSPKAGVSPLAIIVNPTNPLNSISLTQAASMFAKPQRARVFTHWSQVGAQAEFGQKAIEPAGLPWSDHYRSEDRSFCDYIFFGKFSGAPPVDNYRMFPSYDDVVRFVAATPDAIGIVALNHVTAAVKVLNIADGPFGTLHPGTTQDIAGGHYPLDRFLYLYARVQAGKPLDPLVREYLTMVLSPAGQAAIAAEGEGYLPLNATEIGEEEGKFQ